ncbi:MAG: LemA family protein [Paludibacteraceae bacterium]|nr:LemA family protein [Paludibacteraceae bacterium]
MKKGLSWIVVLGVLAIIALWVANVYNGLVVQQEDVETAWAQVENQYQRRIDLIPNLVATVKGYATHEQETLQGVIDARAKATQVTVDPTNATPEQLAAFQAAQGELSQALGRLLAVAESYPDLKANENFRDLQQQLEGTENRIAVARQTFNDTARKYNTEIRRFPKNIIAGAFGFERKPYFEAEDGAEKAPKVEF